MSELVKFVAYYGPGTVRANEFGVDLSEFARLDMYLPPGAETVSISQVKQWFTENFSLDPETCSVSIDSVWSKSAVNIYWELKKINRTAKWVGWLQACKRRGCHPVALVLPTAKEIPLSEVRGGGYQSGECSRHSEEMDVSRSENMSYIVGGSDYMSHTGGDGYERGENTEPEVDANSVQSDDDEEEDDIMEDEDMDGLAEDLDSDGSNEDEVDENDEEVPIPSSWNQELASVMTVDDGHESGWEYHQNNIEIGAMYPSKKHLKEAIAQWVMSTQRSFQTDVSSQKNLTMTCINEGCPARVHGYVPKYDVIWVVSDVVPHTCVLKSVLTDHPNLTSTLVAQLLYSEIVEKKDMVVKAIQIAVKTRFKYSISYGKAWRAKQKAMEARFGAFDDSYDTVVRLLETLQARNPGTHVDIQHFVHPQIPNVKVLQRLFFSFAICIEAFIHCQPVLFVDGTFLTGKYRGQILTAIGVDGNNQILPIAMSFVEGENFESWLWFFRQLKIAIVKDRPNVCIIHDRHSGMLKAIKALQEPANDEPTPWMDLQSRWCMRHLGANFYSQFRSKRLMNMFKRLCKQNQKRKYDFYWDKLVEFTKQQVKQRKAAEATTIAAAITTVPESIGLCDLPGFDPPGTRRKSGRRIKNFAEWIEKEPPAKWSLLHDTHGARYGHMTTNLAEVYNFVLRGNRALPLTAIVEAVMHGTIRYFKERRQRADMHIMNNPSTPYCERIMHYMADKIEKARSHTVIAIGNQQRRYEVHLPTDKFGTACEMKTHEVKIGTEVWPTCECSCNKPKLLHLPCSHVLAVCGQLKMDTISFVSEYYLKDSVLNTWTGEMVGFRVVGNFNKVDPQHRQYIPDPSLMRRSRGRRQAARIRNDMDQSEAGGPTRQCFLCNEFGHMDRYCPTNGRGGGRGNRGRRGRGRG
jgi:hypothetical protein